MIWILEPFKWQVSVREADNNKKYLKMSSFCAHVHRTQTTFEHSKLSVGSDIDENTELIRHIEKVWCQYLGLLSSLSAIKIENDLNK